jgi:hypothetical protein
MRSAAVLLACLSLAVPARAAGLDPHLPADTERYLSIDVKQILESAVGKKLGDERLKGLLQYLPETNALLDELGIDPLKDVDRLQIASSKSTENDKGLMILTGRFDAAKIKKRAEDTDKFATHQEKVGNATVTLYEVKKAGKGVFVALPDNKTLLASGGKEYVVGALKQAREAKKPALKDKQVQAVLQKLDPKLAVGVAVRGGGLPKSDLLDLVPRAIRQIVEKVEVIGGGAGFTDEVKFSLVGSAKTEDDAKAVRETVGNAIKLVQVGVGFLGNENKVVNLVREVLETMRVGGRDKLVTFTARLSADVLDDFTKE